MFYYDKKYISKLINYTIHKTKNRSKVIIPDKIRLISLLNFISKSISKIKWITKEILEINK